MCPDQDIASQMIELIKEVRKEGDTIGGVVTCVIKGLLLAPLPGLRRTCFRQIAYRTRSCHAEYQRHAKGLKSVQDFGVKMQFTT